MYKSKRGEIATVVAIVMFVVIGVSTIASSVFISQNKQTTNSQAQDQKCPGGSCGYCGQGGWWDQGCYFEAGKVQPKSSNFCRCSDMNNCVIYSPVDGYVQTSKNTLGSIWCGNDCRIHPGSTDPITCGSGAAIVPTLPPVPTNSPVPTATTATPIPPTGKCNDLLCPSLPSDDRSSWISWIILGNYKDIYYWKGCEAGNQIGHQPENITNGSIIKEFCESTDTPPSAAQPTQPPTPTRLPSPTPTPILPTPTATTLVRDLVVIYQNKYHDNDDINCNKECMDDPRITYTDKYGICFVSDAYCRAKSVNEAFSNTKDCINKLCNQTVYAGEKDACIYDCNSISNNLTTTTAPTPTPQRVCHVETCETGGKKYSYWVDNYGVLRGIVYKDAICSTNEVMDNSIYLYCNPLAKEVNFSYITSGLSSFISGPIDQKVEDDLMKNSFVCEGNVGGHYDKNSICQSVKITKKGDDVILDYVVPIDRYEKDQYLDYVFCIGSISDQSCFNFSRG